MRFCFLKRWAVTKYLNQLSSLVKQRFPEHYFCNYFFFTLTAYKRRKNRSKVPFHFSGKEHITRMSKLTDETSRNANLRKTQMMLILTLPNSSFPNVVLSLKRYCQSLAVLASNHIFISFTTGIIINKA